MSKINTYPKTLNVPAENVSFYTPKQEIRAGTPVDPQPNGKEIPPLFTPLKIRGLTLQNRIGVSPMVQYSADNGKVTPWHFQHYSSFATRGPGLIFAEASAIVPEGRASPEDAGIWSDELAEAWKPIVEFAHSQGEIMGIQLGHSGRKSSTLALIFPVMRGATPEEKGWPEEVYGPSPTSFNSELYYTPKELSKSAIHDIIKKYGEAATRSVEIAKFDFIEIHAAHGYLVNEFLSSSSNKRTDEYGGSFENRARFLLEVIDEIRSIIPKDMPLFVRVSADENTPSDPEAWTIEDTKKLADLIIPRGIDLIDVSSGGNNYKQEARGAAEGFHVNLTAELKKHVGDRALVSTVGGLKHAEFANNLIKDGKADLVLVARNFLKNPGLVWQWGDELGVRLHQAAQYKRAH